jgi:hypothetical protein
MRMMPLPADSKLSEPCCNSCGECTTARRPIPNSPTPRHGAKTSIHTIAVIVFGNMLSVCRTAVRASFVRCFASVSAADVKVLRDRTGAPMLDCKEALKACNGDTSKAIDWLRQKGISKGKSLQHGVLQFFSLFSAASKSSRAASRGLVTVSVDGNRGSMIELNSETCAIPFLPSHIRISCCNFLHRDFVAMNASFHKLAGTIASVGISI